MTNMYINSETKKCSYLGLGKTCHKNINCRDTACMQHPEYRRNGAIDAAYANQKYVGRYVYGYKEGRCAYPGTLLKVFVKGNKVIYRIKEDTGNVGNFSGIEISAYKRI